MQISFQLNSSAPLHFKEFFSRLEVPVNVTLKGIYKGKLISGTFYHFVCDFRRPERPGGGGHGWVVFL